MMIMKKMKQQYFEIPRTSNGRLWLKNSVLKFDKQIVKLIWKFKRHIIVNHEKKKVGGFPLADFKLLEGYRNQYKVVLV